MCANERVKERERRTKIETKRKKERVRRRRREREDRIIDKQMVEYKKNLRILTHKY